MSRIEDTIDRLVNVWIDGLRSLTRDAGWGGSSMLAMYLDYGKWVSGSHDKSNAAMIIAIQNLREEHADFKKIDVIMRGIIEDSWATAAAITAKNALKGLNPATDKPWKNHEKAVEAGLTYQQYRHYLNKAYNDISLELSRFERYRNAG